MGVVQNIIGLIRDINERKEDARINNALRNNLNDLDLGLEEIMRINPRKGMALENDLFTRRRQEAELQDSRNQAVIDRLGVVTRYLRGVPFEQRAEVMESYAPLFHELIGPDNYNAFRQAALSDPNYLAAVDDNTFREMFKNANEMRTVTPGSVVLRGGEPIFRNPHRVMTSNIPQGAIQRVFDPNTGTYLDEDDAGYDSSADDPSPVAEQGVRLTVDAVRPHIVQQESGGDYTAVNPTTGALGAYQVMPATGRALAERLGLPWRPDMMRSDDPASIRYQDTIGGAAIAEAIDASGGDPRVMAMYYHGGSNRSQWGPRTNQYADQIVSRLGGGQAQSTAQPVLGRRTTINPRTSASSAPGRILSPEEAEALGFSPGTVVQQDGRGYRVLQSPPRSSTSGASSAAAQRSEETRRNAQRVLDATLGSLANNYVELFNMGAATSSSRSPAQNVLARLGSSRVGQLIGEATGTEAQTIRQTIRNATPILMNTIRQAAEMGVRGMDSNKELEFYTQAVGDVTRPIESNLAALVVLDMAYGSQTGDAILRQLPPSLRSRVQRQIDIITRRDNIRFGRPGEGLFRSRTDGLQRLGNSQREEQDIPIGTIIRNPRTGQRMRRTTFGWENIQ